MMLLEVNNSFFSNVGEEINKVLADNVTGQYKYLNLNEQQSVVLLADGGCKNYREMGERLVKAITEHFGKRCYIAVSRSMDYALREIGSTFSRLEDLMESKFYCSESKVFLEEEQEEGNVFARIDEDALMKQMK